MRGWRLQEQAPVAYRAEDDVAVLMAVVYKMWALGSRFGLSALWSVTHRLGVS